MFDSNADGADGQGEIPAGRLARWVVEFREHMEQGTATQVACGSCTACCRSSQFVDIEPDESDALAHIPAQFLAPAPGRPEGHKVMAHDESGRCPMLGEAGCTIYEHRPRACRIYDCRVFAATAITPDQPLIGARAGQWRFEVGDDADRDAARALAAAAGYLGRHFPDSPATARAAAAVLVCDAFSDPGAADRLEPDDVAALILVRMSGPGGGRPARNS